MARRLEVAHTQAYPCGVVRLSCLVLKHKWEPVRIEGETGVRCRRCGEQQFTDQRGLPFVGVGGVAASGDGGGGGFASFDGGSGGFDGGGGGGDGGGGGG